MKSGGRLKFQSLFFWREIATIEVTEMTNLEYYGVSILVFLEGDCNELFGADDIVLKLLVVSILVFLEGDCN